MCIICKEWEAERLTNEEAYRAIGEFVTTSKTEEEVQHLLDLSEKILEKLEPEPPVDEGLDADWWEQSHEE